MKKIIVYLVFCFFIPASTGQNIGLSGGINRNHYFDWQKDEGHFMAEYTPGYGYCAELSFSELKFDSLTINISLLVDDYKGSIYTQNGGMGGASTTVADVEKTCIGIGLYPLNFSILKKIKLSFGGEFSYKINDVTNGYKSDWVMYGHSSYMTIENDSVQINNNFVWGLSGKLSYNFKINRDWTFTPQHSDHNPV